MRVAISRASSADVMASCSPAITSVGMRSRSSVSVVSVREAIASWAPTKPLGSLASTIRSTALTTSGRSWRVVSPSEVFTNISA